MPSRSAADNNQRYTAISSSSQSSQSSPSTSSSIWKRKIPLLISLTLISVLLLSYLPASRRGNHGHHPGLDELSVPGESGEGWVWNNKGTELESGLEDVLEGEEGVERVEEWELSNKHSPQHNHGHGYHSGRPSQPEPELDQETQEQGQVDEEQVEEALEEFEQEIDSSFSSEGSEEEEQEELDPYRKAQKLKLDAHAIKDRGLKVGVDLAVMSRCPDAVSQSNIMLSLSSSSVLGDFILDGRNGVDGWI